MHARLDAPPASLQATTRIPRGHEQDRKKTSVLLQSKHMTAQNTRALKDLPVVLLLRIRRRAPNTDTKLTHDAPKLKYMSVRRRCPHNRRRDHQKAAHDAATDRASTLKETPSLSDEGASTPMQAQRTPSGAPKRAARGKCKKAKNASRRGAIAHRRSARTPRRVDADYKSADPARSAQRH